MVSVVWTEISIEDLKEIFDFIAADSNRYATITVDKIYHRVESIAASPYTVSYTHLTLPTSDLV